MYTGSFSCREDVEREFNVSLGEEVILFAGYDQDGYDGAALVIFALHGKLYEVYGSHCSYYGLEDQWEPGEIDINYLRHVNTYGSKYNDWGFDVEYVCGLFDGILSAG